ncbi:MAG: glutaredoxin family protein [Betaproteobacteria bacterium]|nr:glutaredoxin family protein [Betaproteobacteria bacterium]
MKIWPILITLPLAIASTMAAAQLYRWIDADGKVNFSDTPPPPGARDIQQKKVPAGGPGDEALPYAVREAARNFPVVLFNADCGTACTKAAQLLNSRGVPFAEKNPRQPADAEALKKLTGGDIMVPVVQIGRTVLRGFDEDEWNLELDTAGYPRTGIARPRPARATAPVPVPAAGTPQAAVPEAAQPAPQPEVQVTVFTTDCGDPCANAKDLLGKRGVKYAERDARDPENREALRLIIGPNPVLPVLIVGTTTVRSFDEGAWNAALDAAGFSKAP